MMNEIIDGKYEVLSKIGSGGTSVVYKARRIEDGAVVAIKMLRDNAEDTKESEKQFRHEVEALSQMSHKNIRRIFAVGMFEDCLYMVTEFVDGDTLKDLIRQNGPLEERVAVDYALQITAGIEHAHLRNIIHRDIKSQNILVNHEGTVKIVDFGISRILSQSTRTMGGRDVVGSVHYISPEQARGSVVDSRTDIYSLGILLYEMFTGKLPFEGDEAVTIAMKHVNQIPENPLSVNPSLSRGINDIILKCIQKDPALRYQNVSELREDLLLYVANPSGFHVSNFSRLSVNETQSESEAVQEGRPDVQKVRTAPIRHFVAPEQIETDDEAEDQADGEDYEEGFEDDFDDEAVPEVGERARVRAEQGRRRVIFIFGAILLVLLLIVVCLLVIPPLFRNSDSTEYEQKPIPEITNIGKDPASEVLRRNGFQYFRYEHENSAEVPEGFVIRTEPGTGELQYVNETITLILSDGPTKVMVESTIGLFQEEATKKLNDAGFEVAYEYQEGEKPDGTVIGQDIKGQTAPQGTTITLTLSQRVARLQVPYLIGLSKEEAEKRIADAGFSVGDVKEVKVDSPGEKLGVVEQSPEAGMNLTVKNGSKPAIDFTVHEGKAYRCGYSYEVEGDPKSYELVLSYENGTGVGCIPFNEVNRVSYVYYSEVEETIVFELYCDNQLIDKKTVKTVATNQ